MIQITRIRAHEVHDKKLYKTVINNIIDLCDSFTCIPSETMVICQSSAYSTTDIGDILRSRGVDMEHVILKDM